MYRLHLVEEPAFNATAQVRTIKRHVGTWLRQGVLIPVEPGLYETRPAKRAKVAAPKRSGVRAFGRSAYKARRTPATYREWLALAGERLHSSGCWCVRCNPAPKRA